MNHNHCQRRLTWDDLDELGLSSRHEGYACHIELRDGRCPFHDPPAAFRGGQGRRAQAIEADGTLLALLALSGIAALICWAAT